MQFYERCDLILEAVEIFSPVRDDHVADNADLSSWSYGDGGVRRPSCMCDFSIMELGTNFMVGWMHMIVQ